jgi:hypothetical protein
LHPIGCIIDGGGGDGWGQGIHSKRWSSFGVSGDLLVHLLFFIGVTEEDDVAVPGRTKKLTVEFTEGSLGELLIPRGVGEDFVLIGRKIHQRDYLGGPVVLMNW